MFKPENMVKQYFEKLQEYQTTYFDMFEKTVKTQRDMAEKGLKEFKEAFKGE